MDLLSWNNAAVLLIVMAATEQTMYQFYLHCLLAVYEVGRKAFDVRSGCATSTFSLFLHLIEIHIFFFFFFSFSMRTLAVMLPRKV